MGYALRTIREGEDAAAAIGINPIRYKVMAGVVSAVVAGLVGFFYASYTRYIDPELMVRPMIVLYKPFLYRVCAT
jgi:branched-chain amino acid transport system permease protein